MLPKKQVNRMDEETQHMLEDHERRLSALERRISMIDADLKQTVTDTTIGGKTKPRGKKNSTAAKLAELITDGFFDERRTLNDIISHFKKMDYHFKQSDLTMPLRRLVRKDLLRREKVDGKWAYFRPKTQERE